MERSIKPQSIRVCCHLCRFKRIPFQVIFITNTRDFNPARVRTRDDPSNTTNWKLSTAHTRHKTKRNCQNRARLDAGLLSRLSHVSRARSSGCCELKKRDGPCVARSTLSMAVTTGVGRPALPIPCRLSEGGHPAAAHRRAGVW